MNGFGPCCWQALEVIVAESFTIVIPVRLQSTRLPDKPLADIQGKPMIQWVWERALGTGAGSCHIATDSSRIAEVARSFGASVVTTASAHESGTSRLAEAVGHLGLNPEEIVVNLQGDEPLMPGACLVQVADLLRKHPDARMSTLYEEITDADEWNNPNVVKVVLNTRREALYFSRAPIPFSRDGDWSGPRRHLGIYGYRAESLRQWSALPDSPLESAERLEQLRALDAGWTIVADRAIEPVPPGIDTAEDLQRVRALMK